VKHGSTYFLMYSAGGPYTSPNYAIGYATASSPLGPWTKHAQPLLQRTADVSGPGHHSIVASPDGKELFCVYHTQTWLAGGHGRQLAIDRFRFVDDGGGRPRLEVAGPTRAPQRLPSGAPPFARGAGDDFQGATLDRSRWLVYNEDPTSWRLEKGALVIETQPGDIWEWKNGMKNIFLEYAPEGDFEAETDVAFEPHENFEQACLLLWQSQNDYVRFSTVHANGPKLEMAIEEGGRYRSELVANDFGPRLRLKLRVAGGRVSFHASKDGVTWKAVGPVYGTTFALPKIGIGATATDSESRREARFFGLRLAPCGTAEGGSGK
jgi:beta-xylosidase